MNRLGWLWLLIVISACADEVSQTPVDVFPDAALVVAHGAAIEVELRSAPQPPVRGSLELELTITAADDGRGIAGLDVTVEPWMPAMGHGSHDVPVVVDAGAGIYRVSRVGCHMPGLWILKVDVSDDAGSVDEHVELAMQVR